MIMRFFLISGFMLLGVTGYFTMVQQPPAYQTVPEIAEVTRLQKKGILPSGEITENNEVGHGIFEIPAMDKEMLTAVKSGGMDGMDMGGMGGMNMGDMDMETGRNGGDGLRFSDDVDFDREITLSMMEWGFSDLRIEVRKGEKIRFTVHNTGKLLHEFMFMTIPAMVAVHYRVKRADWNLLEHAAIFEQSLVLPNGKLSFVVEIQEAGSWMFMCMLPYHMQLGMMGQMSTHGMAVDMGM